MRSPLGVAAVLLPIGFLGQSVDRTEPAPVGCYAVAYGPWSFGGQSMSITDGFELRSELQSPGGADSARVVRAVTFASVHHATSTRSVWRRYRGDSITVWWDPYVGVVSLGGQTEFTLAVSPDTLRGIAEFETDQVSDLGPSWATVLVVRVSCDSADSSRSGATVRALAAWASAQVMDSALVARRMVEAFERNRRNNDGVGPTMFSDFVREYYAAHGRLPPTARDAYPRTTGIWKFLPRDLFLDNAAGFPYVLVSHGDHFDVIDVGPDGKRGTTDDRVWRNISARSGRQSR
jgi:hypothetical protein